jgi:hypothetical protein
MSRLRTWPLLPLVGSLLAATGCNATGDGAPPSLQKLAAPEIVFLVRNEVFSIRLDGTERRSLGKVGDNLHRTGFPRLLPDGRMAVLADDDGAIFPWVSEGNGAWMRLPQMNVSFNDALCGVRINGVPHVVFTASPTSTILPMWTRVHRIDPDEVRLETVLVESGGQIADPAPYGDNEIIAVRNTRTSSSDVGVSTVEVLPVDVLEGRRDGLDARRVLASVEGGTHLAAAPARLDDGRVVFLVRRPGGIAPKDVGELFVIERDGTVRSTGVVGVQALVAVGNRVVYEAGGATDVPDLVASDLVNPPVNVTNTPFVGEHLGWSSF